MVWPPCVSVAVKAWRQSSKSEAGTCSCPVVSAGCHSSVRGGAHKWAPPLAYEKLEPNWYLICWSAVWDVETPQTGRIARWRQS